VAEMDQPAHKVTRVLEAIQGGDLRAADELLPLVYDELRRLAAYKLSQEKPGQTLQATGLVHEAYIRLVGSGDPGWKGRGHFFGAAAEAMRRILVERARSRGRIKRGGGSRRVDVDPGLLAADERPEELLALDEALAGLAAQDAPCAEVVKLHFFGGLTLPETARALGVSLATAERRWSYARAWLRVEMEGEGRNGPG
jgi:RNA polymerase sigma factor (TIGR02999 family)